MFYFLPEDRRRFRLLGSLTQALEEELTWTLSIGLFVSSFMQYLPELNTDWAFVSRWKGKKIDL